MSKGYLAVLAATVGVVSASCGDDSVSGDAVRVDVVSGDSQMGVVGGQLAKPLVVKVTDAAGTPVENQAVSFRVVSVGGSTATDARVGSASPTIVTTDASGTASTTWILGSTPGTQILRAAADDASPATFTAAASAATPVRIEVVAGNAQTGVAGAQIGDPLLVKVTDLAGTPLVGQLVSFRVAAGGGSAVAGSAVTDEDGLAQDRWVLGTAAGAQRMEARIVEPVGASIMPAAFDAVAVAGPAASVEVIAGSGQAAEPGTALVVPLRARVTDRYGNPVAATAVTFGTSAENGSASPAMAMTDASGIVETTWSLGSALGTQTLDAMVEGAAAATFTATARQTVAQTSDAAVAELQQGITPFIHFVQLSGASLARLTATRFTIAAKPGSASRPVEATYTIAALQRRGYVGPGTVTLPVFGLYAGTVNDVSVQLQFDDESRQQLPISISTAPYVDPNAIYDRPTILKQRAPGTALGFDFFYSKSALGTPVVLDSDGEIRWIAAGATSSFASAFIDNAFWVGAQSSTTLSRIELDGAVTEVSLLAPAFTHFHHNIDAGKHGLLVEVDAIDGGVASVESNIADVTAPGVVVHHWDFAALLRDHMRSHGDDPDAFIRPGVDWLHMNGATYDRRDDSLIVSSRENFVIKIDYTTGEIRWILGDPTKYWYTFPSLRAKALTLEPGGFYPVGQHAPSITSDGLLMVFNNGLNSANQPNGQPRGENRTFSVVSAYEIDEINLTAREAWRFDNNASILSMVCSSVYEAANKSLLVDYAVASGFTKARLVALNPAHEVVFDFEFGTTSCNTSWNAQPIAFDNLVVE